MFDQGRFDPEGVPPAGGSGVPADHVDDVRLPPEPSEQDRAVVRRILDLEATERAGAAQLADAGSCAQDLERLRRLGADAFVEEARARESFARGLRAVHGLVTEVLAQDRALQGRERSEAMEHAVHEVAAALGISRRTAEIRVADAAVLVEELPRTLAVLGAGFVPVAAARELAHRLGGRAADLRGVVEARVLDVLGAPAELRLGSDDWEQLALTARLEPDRAATVSLGASRSRVRDLCARALRELGPLFPERAAETAEPPADSHLEQPAPAATGAADIEVWPSTQDESVLIGAPVRPDQVVTILARLEHLARRSKRAGDPRTLRELRVAWYVALLMARPGGAALSAGPEGDAGPDLPGELAPVPVHLTLHLTGDGDVLVDDDRLGPVGRDTLSRLLRTADETAGRTHLRRVRMPECPGHPVGADGAVLDPGPYEPPPCLREAVQARDRTCRFPGCTVPARHCDVDHSIPHPRGPTCACNLGCLCRAHHRLKTSGRWRLTNHGDGRFTWTGPTGRTYTVTPDPP